MINRNGAVSDYRNLISSAESERYTFGGAALGAITAGIISKLAGLDYTSIALSASLGSIAGIFVGKVVWSDVTDRRIADYERTTGIKFTEAQRDELYKIAGFLSI